MTFMKYEKDKKIAKVTAYQDSILKKIRVTDE